MISNRRAATVAAALAAFAACAACGPTAPATTSAPPPVTTNSPTTTTPTDQAMRVTEVVDADTVKLAAPTGAVITVRVLGIGTPETKDPRKPVQCWDPQASAWAITQLTGKQVTLRSDPTQDVQDTDGRTPGYLTLPDGSDYSIEAARAGMARYYLDEKPIVEATQIQTAEAEARAAQRGLWGPPCYGNVNSPAPTTTTTAPRPAPRTTTQTTPPPPPATRETGSGSVYYANCTAARAAGAAPLHRGDPGYRPALDRDSDGIACEQ